MATNGMGELNTLEHLDPGIVAEVTRLRAFGYQTTDSGDGVSKPKDCRTFDVPHVMGVLEWSDGSEPVSRTLLQAHAHAIVSLLGREWRCEISYSTDPGSRWLFIATKPTDEAGA